MLKPNSIAMPGGSAIPPAGTMNPSRESAPLLGTHHIDLEGDNAGICRRLWASPAAGTIAIGVGVVCGLGISAAVTYLTTHNLQAVGGVLLVEAAVLGCIANGMHTRSERLVAEATSRHSSRDGEARGWQLSDFIPGIGLVRSCREVRRQRQVISQSEAGHDEFLRHIATLREEHRAEKRPATARST